MTPKQVSVKHKPSPPPSADPPRVERRKITDLVPDARNANRGTERGLRMLEDSIAEVGLGRSIVIDKHGTIIGGNKTQEVAVERGLAEAIVVHSDGQQLVVVQRDDLDLSDDDGKARRLAYFDNRTASVDLDFDPAMLDADVQVGVDLDGIFREDEIDDLLAQLAQEVSVEAALDEDAAPQGKRVGHERLKQIKPVLYADDVATFERALRATGLTNRGEALVEVCRAYLAVVEDSGVEVEAER